MTKMHAKLLILAFLPLALAGCAELDSLRIRSEQQEQYIADLKRENEEFNKAYYDISEKLEAERTRAQQQQELLGRELEQAKNLRSEKEKQLADDLRTLNLEHEALREEATAQKTIADAQINRLTRQTEDTAAERDAALQRLSETSSALDEERKRATALTQANAQLKVDLQTREDRIKTLAEEVKAAQARVEKLTADLTALDNDRKKAVALGAELKTMLENTEKELAAAQANVQKLTEANKTDELQAGIDALKQQLAAKDKALADSAARLAETETKLTASEKSVASVKAELEKAKSQAPPKPKSLTEDDALIVHTVKLRELLGALPGGDRLTIRLDSRGLRVILPVDAIFDPRSTLLSEAGKSALDQLAPALKAIEPRQIRIEGHTDDQPVQDMPYADNWSLAFARADNVRKYLMTQTGWSGDRVTALSRAWFDPIEAGNAAANRRIEIVFGEKP